MSRGSISSFGVLLVACGVLTAATPAAAQSQPSKAEAAVLRSYYSGNGFLNRGLYDLAAAEYRKFLNDHPTHEKAAVARYGLGVSLFRQKQFAPAVTELESLVGAAGFPYGAEVAMILGQSHLAMKAYGPAAEAFGVVVRDHAGHELADDALATQAESYYRAGRFDEVATPCETLVQQHAASPHRERAELYWGLSDVARRRFAEAATRFEGMIGRFPGGAYADQTQLLFAQALHQSQQINEASLQYHAVIDRGNPQFAPDALYGLALLQHLQQRLDDAGRSLDQLLGVYPQDDLVDDAHLLRGRVFADQGRNDEAAEHFLPVSEAAGPLQDDACYWLAKCDLRRNDPESAGRRLDEAIARFPESELIPDMHYDRAVALLRSERTDEAMDSLSTFRQEHADHRLAADALHLMAVTLHQAGDHAQSRSLCDQFLAAYPAHPSGPAVKFLAGENEFLPARYPEAAAIYREFLADFPGDALTAKAQFRLGMALYHQDQLDEAEGTLRQVLAGPDTQEAFAAALLALGDGHYQRDQWVEAERYLGDYLAGGADRPAADDALLKLGLARHRQENFAGALEAYGTIIESFPDSPHRPQAIFERGQAHVAMRDIDAAAVAFEELLETAPGSRFSGHALNHLGAIAMQRNDYLGAATRYAAVPENDPNGTLTSEALYQQGQALMAAERFDVAAEVFDRLVAGDPAGPRAAQGSALQAIALARGAMCEAALAKMDEVRRGGMDGLEPSLIAAVIYEQAWCQRDLDRAKDAAASYRELLAQPVPGELQRFAMLELAELEFDGENYPESVRLLEQLRAVAADPGQHVPAMLQEQAAYRLGLSEFHLENHDKAAALLETFIATYPDSRSIASASFFCGESMFHAGSHAKAVENFTRVVERFPDDEVCAPSLLRLGESLAVLQQFGPSRDAFQTHLDRFPDAPTWYQAHFGVGWALENLGRHDDAIASYQSVIDGHQGSTAARAQFQVGQCYFAMNNLEQAARELLKVDILYAYPEWSAAALYEAGRCFQELSNPVDARKQFEKVVNEHGDTDWAGLAQQRLAELTNSGLPGQ